MKRLIARIALLATTATATIIAQGNDGWIDIEDRELRASAQLEAGIEKFEETAANQIHPQPDEFQYKVQKRNEGRSENDIRFYFRYRSNTNHNMKAYYIFFGDVVHGRWKVVPVAGRAVVPAP